MIFLMYAESGFWFHLLTGPQMNKITHRIQRALVLVASGLQRRLRSGEPCDGHAERRARYVIEPRIVAESDGFRIAAMFAANAEFQFRARFAAAFDSDFYQLAHTRNVNGDEGIAFDETAIEIFGEETSRIVA